MAPTSPSSPPPGPTSPGSPSTGPNSTGPASTGPATAAAARAETSRPPTGLIPLPGNDGVTDEPHLSAPGFRMFDRGAHVTHWQPEGHAHPVLYSSSIAVIGPDRAWRGGIPICAPWFDAGRDGRRSPRHGPARTALWLREAELVSGTRHVLEVDVDADGEPALLVLEYETQRTDRTLELRLTITNTGRETAPVEAALHSYFAVSDVTHVAVRGLESATLFDKVTGEPWEAGAPLEFGSLVDRVYDDGLSDVEIVDDAWQRTLRVERLGSTKTVIWNPGPANAPSDVGEGEWRSFVCVEAAIVGDALVRLGPDQSHRIESAVTIESADHT